MPENDVAAAFAALGQSSGPPPYVYVLALQSGNMVTRGSRLNPTDLLAEIESLEALKGPRAWFRGWMDGDGTRVGEIADVMYVPQAGGK